MTLIHWMLGRLLDAPMAVFSQTVLKSVAPDEFQWAVDARLLRSAGSAKRYIGSDGVPRSTYNLDGASIAIADDDPDVAFERPDRSDQARWCLDLLSVGRRLHEANALEGAAQRIDEQTIACGRRGDTEIALFVGRDVRGLRPELHGIQNGSVRNRVLALVLPVAREPSLLDAPDWLRLADLPPLGSQYPVEWHITESLEGQQASEPAKLQHSPNYRSVALGGLEWTLTPAQAHVVRMLDQRLAQGEPDLAWADIAAGLESLRRYPKSMSDVFKGVADWRRLLTSRLRGTYRLNL